MSNELKIDITKLTTEDLERIRFLFPEEVEKEFNARASYKNDMDLFVDIYYAQRILVPLIENMKSCPTKKALLDSNILETMVKVLNTADVRERDYKKAYEEMIDFAKKCVDNDIKTTLTVVDEHPDYKLDISACEQIAKEVGADFRIRKWLSKGY